MRRAPAFFLAAAVPGCGLIAVLTWRTIFPRASETPGGTRATSPAAVRAPIPAERPPSVANASGAATPATQNSAAGATDAEIADALREAIRAPSLVVRETVYSQSIAGWAARSPAALERARTALAQGSEDAALRVSVQLWAARDFPAAYQWALHLDDPSRRSLALASAFYQSEREAPQATLELAQHAPLGDMREIVLQRLALQWAAGDCAAATAWAMSQPVTGSRDGVFQEIALARARADPAESAHLILVGISPGAVQEETVARALARWPAAEFAQAVAWVRQFPAGALRRRAEAELRAAFGQTP